MIQGKKPVDMSAIYYKPNSALSIQLKMKP
jgi:hypothetical protein